MTGSGQLRLPSCCPADPVKSSASESPARVARSPQLEVAVRGLEHVVRLAYAVLELGEPGAGAPFRVVERLLHAGPHDVEAEALHECLDTSRAGAVGRELRAQVRLPLARVPHARRQLPQQLVVEARGRDHHALVRERARVGGHAAGLSRSDVGVMGTAGGEARELAGAEDRRDHRDVGEVRPAPIGVVEDPRAAGLLVLVHDRLHRRGHRPEVHGDVLGLHHHPPALVEQRGRRVAPLLDVRRVRRAHEHGAHLLARRPQPAEHHLQGDRVQLTHRCAP